jgi:hypothetical protein
MSLKINFYPFHYIASLLVLVALVVVFNDTIYVYMSSNIYINGLIIILFIVCTIWILGVLSYYSRSARVLNRLLGSINPAISQQNKKDSTGDLRRQSLYVASSIGGTLFDTPIFSRAIVSSIRAGRLEIGLGDTDVIIGSVMENGDRVLGLSKFLTSIFTMLGLMGTFIGLLQTIDGVGKALGALANIQNVDILSFVKLLADPLQGMSVAFSTSLFGLVSALFGNYGNYVCAQKLSVFANKFKNFLTASSVVAIGDSAKIEAKDILISLEDSFNRLYVGLAERLDVLSDGILGMSKAIVRAQEKQDQTLKVILENFVSMEELWTKFIKTMEVMKRLANLPADFNAIVAKNRSEFFAYFNSNVMKVLTDIASSVSVSNKIQGENLENSKNILSVSSGTLDGVRTSNALSENILFSSEAGNDISRNVLDVSALGNSINEGILAATADSVSVERENLGVVSNIMAGVENINNINASILNEISGVGNVSALILDQVSSIRGVNQEINNEVKDYNANFRVYQANLMQQLQAAYEIANGLYEKIPNQEVVQILEVTRSLMSDLATMKDVSIASNAEIVSINSNTRDSVAKLSNIESASLSAFNELLNINNSVNGSSNKLEDIKQGIVTSLGLLEGVRDSSIAVSSNVLEMTNASRENAFALEGVKNSSIALSNTVAAHAEVSRATLDEVAKISSVIDNHSNIVSGAFNRLFSTTDSLVSSLNNNANQLYSIATSTYQTSETANYIASLINQSSENTAEVLDLVASLNDTFSESLNVFNSMSENMSQDMFVLRQSFEDFSSRFVSMISGLEYGIDVLSKASSIGAGLDNTVYNLNSLLNELIPNVGSLINATDRQVDTVGVIMDDLGSIVNSFSSIGYTIDSLSNTMNNNSSYLMSAIDNVIRSNEDYSNKISNGIYDIYDILSKFDQQNYNVLNGMENLVYEFSDLKKTFEDNLYKLYDNVSNSLDNILNAFDYVSSGVSNIGDLTSRVDQFLFSLEDTQNLAIDLLRSDLDKFTNSNRDFLNVVENSLLSVSQNISNGMLDIVSQFENMKDLVNVQVEKLSVIEANLETIASSSDTSLGEVSNQYQDLKQVVSDLNSSFLAVNEGIDSLSIAIASQNGLLEQQQFSTQKSIDASQLFVDSMKDFSEVTANMGGAFNIVSEIKDSLLALKNSFDKVENSLLLIENLSTNQLEAIKSFSSQSKDDISLFYDVINKLDELSNGYLANDIVSIKDSLQEISNYINIVVGDSNASSSNALSILPTVNEIKDSLSDIKNSISSLTSDSLNKIIKNNGLSDENITLLVSSLDKIANFSKENSGLSLNSDLIDSISNLKLEYENGNARLDVIANAIDSLITEMLNSRDVTMAILDMLSKNSTNK